jgi:hypothetical protein
VRGQRFCSRRECDGARTFESPVGSRNVINNPSNPCGSQMRYLYSFCTADVCTGTS